MVEEIEKVIDGYSNDVLNLLCPQEYSIEVGEKCDSIMGQTPALKTEEPRPKSMLIPLIKIFESLKNN